MGTRLNCLRAKTKIVGSRNNHLTEVVLTCTHNLCFEQKYENNQKILTEIVIFTAVKKSLYVAWAGFRNVKHSSLCTDLVNM